MKWGGFIKGFSALLLATAMLSGCSDTTTTNQATSSSGNDTATVSKATQTGTVKIAVKFPQTQKAGKAIIDERTSYIYLYASGVGAQWYSNDWYLTPDPATGIATVFAELPVGLYDFVATAYDSNGVELEITRTGGEIVSGANAVVLSFLTGDWQFVDASNTPTPLVVTDSQGQNIELAGFALKPDYVFFSQPAAANFDPNLPSGFQEYGIQFFTNGIDYAPIGPVIWSEADHQFSAGVASNGFNSDWLNLDEPARSDMLVNPDGLLPSDPLPGQRIAFILDNGMQPDPNENFSLVDTNNPAVNLLPTLQTYADTQLLDGRTMTGHLLEMTFLSGSETLVQSNYNCMTFWNVGPATARAAALSKALAAAGPSKAAPGDETLLAAAVTVEMDDCQTYPSSYYGDLVHRVEQFSNVVAREFRAKAAQSESVFSFGPPAPPVP